MESPLWAEPVCLSPSYVGISVASYTSPWARPSAAATTWLPASAVFRRGRCTPVVEGPLPGCALSTKLALVPGVRLLKALSWLVSDEPLDTVARVSL